MRNDLLTIGEVARLKGVGVKALRYYERIGVLLPALVDERTGYRYYAMSQMPEVDVIIVCVELGVPLRELRTYRAADGRLDVRSMLDRGLALAQGKLRRAQMNVMELEGYRDSVARQRRDGFRPEPYERVAGPCSVLAVPWEGSRFDAKGYLRSITEVHECARRRQFVPSGLYGMVRLPHDGAGVRCQWHVAVEVRALPEDRRAFARAVREGAFAEKGCRARLMSLPGGRYRGWRIVKSGFDACFAEAFDRACDVPDDAVLAVSEVWDGELRADASVAELLRLG